MDTTAFDTLSSEHREALSLVAQFLGTEDEELNERFRMLDEAGGSVPSDCIGDDLAMDIIAKYDAPIQAACELASKKLPKGAELEVIVEPSLEDRTKVVVVLGEHVVWRDSSKAWHFHFKSLKTSRYTSSRQRGRSHVRPSEPIGPGKILRDGENADGKATCGQPAQSSSNEREALRRELANRRLGEG